MVSQTSRLGLDTFSQGEDNWDHTDTVNQVDETAHRSLADSGTITLTGGSSPAHNSTITDVSSNQLRSFMVYVGVDSDPSFDADYAFNWDYTLFWDDSDSSWDIELTVNWDTDPGSSNDVTASYRIYEE